MLLSLHGRFTLQVFVLTIFLSAPLGKVESRADDWPQFRGPRLDGVSLEKDWSHAWPASGPTVAWEAAVGIGFSSMAVAGERVYTLGHSEGHETVYCFDSESGEVVWSYSYPAALLDNLHEGGPGTTPTVHDGLLYTCSKDGRVLCFDAEHGEVVWERQLQEVAEVDLPEWGFTSSGLIHGEEVLFEAGRVVSFDRRTGEVQWRSELRRPGYGTPTPVTAGGQSYFASLNNDGLIVVRAGSGDRAAFLDWETDFATSSTSPIVVDQRIFISTGYNRGCASLQFNGRGLTRVYEHKDMNNHFNQCVLLGGHLYGIHGNSHNPSGCSLRCMDWETGEIRWIQRGFGCGSVTIGGDRLIILSDRGVLTIAQAMPDEYRELARSEVVPGLCWTVPVISHGRIYCRNSSGRLVCLDVRQ